MVTQQNTKRILIFLAFALGIPWTALLVIYLAVRTEDLMKVASTAGLFLGIIPALANVATRLITKDGFRSLWLRPNIGRTASVRGGWRFYLAAWLLPLLAVSAGGGIFFLLFPQSFDPTLSQMRELFASNPFLATHPWLGLLVDMLKNVVLGLVLGLVYFGEEFGWRAYLLPKLMERFTGAEPGSVLMVDPVRAAIYRAGARKAALLVGVIWGVWHWPGYFLYMQVDPGFPILYPLVFLLSTCALSVLLGWVTLRSGSVWPAATGHGVINQVSGLARSVMQGPAMPLLGPGSSGLIGGLGFLILALALLLSRKAFARPTLAEDKEPRPERKPAVAGAQ